MTGIPGSPPDLRRCRPAACSTRAARSPWTGAGRVPQPLRWPRRPAAACRRVLAAGRPLAVPPELARPRRPGRSRPRTQIRRHRRHAAAPTTGRPRLLEARGLTKHFPVHGAGTPAWARGSSAPGRPGQRRRVVHAVEDVSLALPPARSPRSWARAAAGKSTLARMLARLITPTSGEVLLDGKPVPRPAGRRAVRAPGPAGAPGPVLLSQPVHTVRYHLERPLQVHTGLDRGRACDEAISGAAGAGRAHPGGPVPATSTRTSCPAASGSASPSPGRSRCGRGCCWPTSRSRCWTSRSGSASSTCSATCASGERLAILYITHDIASARYLADTIVVMYAGQVVESGPAEEVTDRPDAPLYPAAAQRGARPGPRRAGRRCARRRGAPPSLVTPPRAAGSTRAARIAMAICADAAPPGLTVADGHVEACWLHAGDLDAAQASPIAARRREARLRPPGQGEETP